MGVISYTVFAYVMTAAISYLLMGVVVMIQRATGKSKEGEKEET